jgi:chromosome segregation and condensation protein ScpB
MPATCSGNFAHVHAPRRVPDQDVRTRHIGASSASGNKVLEPLDLPETVWLVLAIVILDQPITRAEITARRMADSDRQVQVLLSHRLIREEPRAAVPGRGIPLITTDLVLRRLGVSWIGDLQHQLLTAAAERELHPSPDTALA